MYRYKITLERVVDDAKPLPSGAPDDKLQFETVNHDDLFSIIARTRSKNQWTEDEAASLALGLKLFSEVVLAHRKEELFAPAWTALHEFIGNFKQVPVKE